nr:glutathione S-transferase family protein [uncultured Roseateles sp.]
MKLYIGNKNYSSWSMRPWVLLKALDIPFEEVMLRFDFSEGSAFYRALAAISPVAKVPVLVDNDGFAVWDTLAIAEYIADRHPELAVWPRDRQHRARARSLCAEMHAGFGALRNLCPMNIEAYLPEIGAKLLAEDAKLRVDLARVDAIFSSAAGPFLFGDFGAADAYFAPVVMRVTRFGLPLSPAAAAYVKAVEQTPAVAAWVADALAEQDFIAADEPYRTQR